jgi:hypothetical protein
MQEQPFARTVVLALDFNNTHKTIYVIIVRQKMLEYEKRIIIWFIFTGLFSLIPIIFRCVDLAFDSIIPTPVLLFSNGELLFISIGIAAAAIGDLIVSRRNWWEYKIILGSFCGFLALLSTYLLGKAVDGHNNSELFSYLSIILFCLTFFSGSCCKGLSELNNE